MDNEQPAPEVPQEQTVVTPQVTAPVDTPPPPVPELMQPGLISKPPKKSKKRLVIVLIILLLIAAGAAAWFVTKDKKQAAKTTTTNTQTENQQLTDDTAVLKPTAVAYAFGTETSGTSELFWRPLTGGERTSAGDIGKNMFASMSDVHRNQVLVVATPGAGGGKMTIRYSKDAGKTYTTVFEGEAPSAEGLGDQITSAVFSTDGSKIVFGYLPKTGGKNTVKELDPATKAVKDLFTTDKPGVFIEGYNVATKQVLYFEGCYNCDGNTGNELLSRTGGAAATIAYQAPAGKLGAGIAIKDDFSKMVVVLGVSGDGIGAGGPYTVSEYDFATKALKTLATVTDANNQQVHVGYQIGTELPYYTTSKTVTLVGKDGKPSIVFEASKPIQEVLFVSDQRVVAASGEYNNYQLVDFTISTKAVVNILNGDGGTRLFGVTWQ